LRRRGGIGYATLLLLASPDRVDAHCLHHRPQLRARMMKYQVWYMKPSFLRGIVGNLPDPNNLSATHVHLKDIEANNQEDALHCMRAEIWSPNGEALDLLQSKGIQHVTMTIGDVLVDEGDAVYLVTAIGFSLLSKEAAGD
jgi:hypothetical protein